MLPHILFVDLWCWLEKRDCFTLITNIKKHLNTLITLDTQSTCISYSTYITECNIGVQITSYYGGDVRYNNTKTYKIFRL